MAYHEPDEPESANETVVDGNDMDWEVKEAGGRFAYKRKRLGIAAGGEQLGCSMYDVDNAVS